MRNKVAEDASLPAPHAVFSSILEPTLSERFVTVYGWLSRLRRRERRQLVRALRMSLAACALLIAATAMPLPTFAASMTVDATASGRVNDGKCSIVEAVTNANNDAQTWVDCPAGSGTDTITLPAGATFSYSSPTSGSTDAALPDITSTIVIEGNNSTIQRTGGSDFRLVNVSGSGNLTLRKTTLTGGHFPNGGGILNFGTLTLLQSTVTGNNGLGGQGGGIQSTGTLTLKQSTVSNNQTPTGNGGGVYITSGIVNIANTTISGNSTEAFGAGIAIAGGTVQITNSTIVGNTSVNFCGGIGIQGGTTSISRSIVSGNTAANYGKEIGNFGTTVYANAVNLFGHSGETGGAAFYGFVPGGADINATSNGGVPTALLSILDTTLANNGGPTLTHALVLGSPAIDKATGDSCQAAPVDGRDGRNYVRASGASTTCDIGAFEFGAPTNAVLGAFNAVYQVTGARVQVKWRTASELNVAGFNLWRQTAGGKWKKLNAALIPAKKLGTVSGTKYTFVDRSIQPAQTYRYKLELVTTANAQWSDIVKVPTQ